MMNNKILFFIFILWAAPLFGLDTALIVQLREQTISQNAPLSPVQARIVEKFWQNAVDVLLLAQNDEEQMGIIDQLVAEKGGENLSFYVSSYIKTGGKYLQSAFESIRRWDSPARRISMERKLMVLIARLQNVGLAQFALERLGSPDVAVRYRAAKTLADPQMIKQLAADTTEADLKNKVARAMANFVENEANFTVLCVAVDFALTVNDDASRNLLLKLAEKRIKAYMDWSVTGEGFETCLLNGLGQLIAAQQPSDERVKLVRAFAQLYYCVIRRYIDGAAVLTGDSKNTLINVIAEVENSAIAKLIPGWQMTLAGALKQNAGLDREAENLLGASSKPGDLSLRLNFSYGRDADGKAIMSPQPLPAAPAGPAVEEPVAK